MYSDDLFATILGGSIIFMLIIGLLIIPIIIVYIIAQWKLFKKAGKKGWEAIIPFYNTYVLIEIAGLNWWYFLIAISGSICTILNIDGLALITNIASMFVNFLCFYNIAKKTKQNEITYAILGALIPFIPVMILGLSNKYVFDNSIAVSPNGIIGDSKTNNNTNNANNTTQNQPPERYCLGCGQRLNSNVKFCENCGKKVEDLNN